MSEPASADMALAEGNNEPTSGRGALEAYFAAQGQQQVDNSDDAVTDEVAETEEETAPEAETEPAKDTEDAEEATEPEPAPEPKEDAADFESLEKGTPEFLDAEGLKAKFPRNSSKELIAEAARYSELAKKGSEVIESIGGEAFVPGMATIAASLKDGNYRSVLGGITETAGPEALVWTIAEMVKMGFCEGETLAKSEDLVEAHFGKTMLAVVDSVIEQRFGESITLSKLSKLAQWEQAGWFEMIEKWSDDNFVDPDEVEQLLEITNDPKLIAKRQELKRTDAEIAEKRKVADSLTTKQQTEVDNSFSVMVADKIETVLSDVVWASSPLRDMKNDTAEVKEEKGLLRSQLIADANALFQGDATKGSLFDGYRTGQSKTAVFQSKFAEAINRAILGTRTKTAVAERIFAKLYGSTRNTQLAQKQNRNAVPANQANRRPTVMPQGGDDTPTDRETLRKQYTDMIAGIGG